MVHEVPKFVKEFVCNTFEYDFSWAIECEPCFKTIIYRYSFFSSSLLGGCWCYRCWMLIVVVQNNRWAKITLAHAIVKLNVDDKSNWIRHNACNCSTHTYTHKVQKYTSRFHILHICDEAFIGDNCFGCVRQNECVVYTFTSTTKQCGVSMFSSYHVHSISSFQSELWIVCRSYCSNVYTYTLCTDCIYPTEYKSNSTNIYLSI